MITAATPRQISFARRLFTERNAPQEWASFFEHQVQTGTTTKAGVSKLIDALMQRPAAQKPTAQPAAQPPAQFAEPGYYVATDGDFVVVVENQAKTATYAKRLVLGSTATGRRKASWDYAPGVARTLTNLRPMTLDEAKSFGHLHGFCFVCLRQLTDPASVEAGIGPVCAKKFHR